MARYTVETKSGEKLSFFVPDQGGHVYLEQGRNHGTLGRQICTNGRWRGSTLSATPDTLEQVTTRWCKARGEL